MRNIALLLVVGALFTMQGVQAGMVDIPAAGFGHFEVKAMSIKERKFRSTVHQKYDFSCGSAALSTLLTYHYGYPVNEETIYKAMWDKGDQAKIRKEGFSLLDMKHFLESKGYAADGYTASLDKLAQVGIPAIVLIREGGYNHFVVIKGIRDGKVAYGDPAQGSRVMDQAQFEHMMINKILFVINGHKEQAVFNSPRDWKVHEKAPIGMAEGPNDLANITLLRRPPGDF